MFYFFYHLIEILIFNYFLFLCVSSSLFLCSVWISQTKTTYNNTISHYQKIQATTQAATITPIRKPNPSPPPLDPSHQPPLQTPAQNQTDNHQKIPSFKPKPKPKSTNNQAHKERVSAIAKVMSS